MNLRNYFLSFIEKQNWISDSTKEYVVKGKLSAEDQKIFEQFVIYIREHGVRKKYKKSFYTHLDLDGFSYWTMGAPLEITIIINRQSLGFYDAISERYDDIFSDKDSERENLETYDLFKDHLHSSVLDIGCGTGLLLDITPAEKRFNYIGIDPSAKMLEKFREKHSGRTTARGVQTTFEDYALKTNIRFDLIVSLFGSISYVNPAFFGKIKDLLRKPESKYFLMFFKNDYFPLTYQRTGICFSHYKTSLALLNDVFDRVYEYSHYVIATNIEGEK